MLYTIHCRCAVWVPEVDLKNVVMRVNRRVVDLFARALIIDNKLNAGRRSDGSSVLVTKTAHARAIWLLCNNQAVGLSIH